MPVNKKDNKKNAPVEKRDSAIVPQKEQSQGKPKGTKTKVSSNETDGNRVNALSTAGKKKKPK